MNSDGLLKVRHTSERVRTGKEVMGEFSGLLKSYFKEGLDWVPLYSQ